MMLSRAKNDGSYFAPAQLDCIFSPLRSIRRSHVEVKLDWRKGAGGAPQLKYSHARLGTPMPKALST